ARANFLALNQLVFLFVRHRRSSSSSRVPSLWDLFQIFAAYPGLTPWANTSRRSAAGSAVPHANLPMTRTATGDIANADLPIRRHQFSRAYLVFRNQVRTQQFLVYKPPIIHRNRTTARRRLIPHVENLIARPQILSGIAMTAE